MYLLKFFKLECVKHIKSADCVNLKMCVMICLFLNLVRNLLYIGRCRDN